LSKKIALMAAMSATERWVCMVSSCSRHHSSSSSVSTASLRWWSSAQHQYMMISLSQSRDFVTSSDAESRLNRDCNYVLKFFQEFALNIVSHQCLGKKDVMFERSLKFRYVVFCLKSP